MRLIDKSHFYDRLAIDHHAMDASEALYRAIDIYSMDYGYRLFGIDNWDYIVANIDTPSLSKVKSLLLNEISPIACYVFYQYQNDKIARPSSNSDVQGVSDNARVMSSDYRKRVAWNEMVSKNKTIIKYLLKNRETFEDVIDYSDLACNMRVGGLLKFENDFGIFL